jgi:hypothetical protein
MDAEKLNDRLRVEEPWESPAASFEMDDPTLEARLVSKLEHDLILRLLRFHHFLDESLSIFENLRELVAIEVLAELLPEMFYSFDFTTN